jgi:Predicted transcriptional regulator
MKKYIGKIVQLIYVDRKRQVSIRNVRVLSVKGNLLKAYCYTAQSLRIFNVDNIVDIELIEGRGLA